MEYNFLGNSGVKVSNMGLGTATFGTLNKDKYGLFDSPRQLDKAASHKIMDRYVELGGNFLDTANFYCYGKTEEIVGSWLQSKTRDDIVLATKVGLSMNKGKEWPAPQNNVGLSRRNIIKSCEESLERLQTNYVDLLQAHVWDIAAPIKDTLRTFDDLIRCGKIRYYGYSNICGWQMQEIVQTANELGLNSCVTLQQHYSLLERTSEREAFAVCRNKGIGILPYSPLMGGLLTGKIEKSEAAPNPTESRIAYFHSTKSHLPFNIWNRYSNDNNFWQLVNMLKQIAMRHEKTVPQVALRWVLQRDMVSSVLMGVTSIKQLEENVIAAGGWRLTDEEMKQLDDATKLEDSYPYTFLQNFNASRN